ncbi:hypothetical protein Hanom_Chr14g01331341 [Helianthus anomalus]
MHQFLFSGFWLFSMHLQLSIVFASTRPWFHSLIMNKVQNLHSQFTTTFLI